MTVVDEHGGPLRSPTYGGPTPWERRTALALKRARDILDVLDRVAGPIVLLVIRLWLAWIFTRHALIAMMGGGTDLQAVVELAGSALLALGLATRIAAIPIAVLSFFVYFVERSVPGHLLCSLLALLLFARGAGPLSLDALLWPGLRNSALPLAGALAGVSRRVQPVVEPLFQLGLRLWLGILFLVSANVLMDAMGRWIEPAVLEAAGGGAAWNAMLALLALMLMVGLGTRFAAALLLVAMLSIYLSASGRIEHGLWALMLSYLLVAGPGPFALDRLVDRGLRRRVPEYDNRPPQDLDVSDRVVIVGAGFGGLAAARELRHTAARVTVIDRHNYHLFQPLLYQVATATLSPADIALPIRAVLRDQPNANVVLGEVGDVDTAHRTVRLTDGRVVPYDHLILATGARHAYFGNDEWAEDAPGLKRIDDATAIRRRILLAFENAEGTSDPEERERHLTFVVVGGGPTGVELAGAIAELARAGMADDFRNFDPADARVILVQAAPSILPMFPEPLRRAALRSLETVGVEVRCESRVTAIDDRGVSIGDEAIGASTVLWAAGVQASPVARWLDREGDRAGRVAVGPDLTVEGLEDIFVIGDTAGMTGPDGEPVPGLAPAAKQSGAHAAKVIRSRIEGTEPPPPFRYRHMGSLATIGRNSAIADFGWLRLSGGPAWWLWGAVHVAFLLGARNRLSLMVSWVWSYLSYRASTRLITGDDPADGQSPPRTAAREA